MRTPRSLIGVALAMSCSSTSRVAPVDAGTHLDGDVDAEVHDAPTARDVESPPKDAATDVVPPRGDARGGPDAETGGTVDATSADARASTEGGALPTTCADGAPVAYTRTSCPGSASMVPAGLAAAAGSANFGAVLSLDGLDESSVVCFPVRVCVAANAPTLLFSDEPESPSADGILYADALVAGAYRAYVYHVNAGADARKFPVVVLNQGAVTVHAIVTAAGLAGPSEDYVDVGKQAAVRWYASEGTTTTVDIPAGARVLLDSDLDGLHAATNELVHAIIDFSIDGPVKLSVVSLDATEDATTATSGLSLLPNSGQHVRGSFPGAALELESVAPLDAAGVRRLRMGANVTDATLAGTDYVDDGMAVTLDGNYGVSYALTVAFAAGVNSALLLSPQGGDWGGAGSTVAGSGPASAPGVLPASQDSLGTQTEALAIVAFNGVPAGTFNFLSAGGSDLPVDVLVVPLP